MADYENISETAFNFLFMALSQINDVKNKVDPEVKDLLLQSATDAISSAKNFLDALDVLVAQLKSSEVQNSNVDLTLEEEKETNVVEFRDSKAQ